MEWIRTESNVIKYSGLGHGTYEFHLKAVDFHGNESLLGKPYPTIKISKKFIETKVFYILIIALFLILVLILFYSSIRTFKKRESLKRQMLTTERRSLLSQMNPHFIFNALNSIQHFFVQRNDKLAHSYLSRLSSLIRRILEFSKLNYILLSEELETIKLYLELEKLRFEEKFSYVVEIDENIDTNNTTIPPMLIQPCLENSIIHGLLPRKSMGKLSLKISKLNATGIKCIIEDDGIGIKNSMEIRRRSRKKESMGLENIRERIKIINRIEKSSIEFNIENLYSNKKPPGTRVIIIIPSKPD